MTLQHLVMDVLQMLVVMTIAHGWGRRYERKKMRHENGWWDGFRHGCSHREKEIQALALERGIVMTFETGTPPKHN